MGWIGEVSGEGKAPTVQYFGGICIARTSKAAPRVVETESGCIVCMHTFWLQSI